MWNGEDLAWMIQSCNICFDSGLANRRHSGARHLGRVETGGPVVAIEGISSCITGMSGIHKQVRTVKSHNSLNNMFMGQRDETGEDSGERIP